MTVEGRGRHVAVEGVVEEGSIIHKSKSKVQYIEATL